MQVGQRAELWIGILAVGKLVWLRKACFILMRGLCYVAKYSRTGASEKIYSWLLLSELAG